MRAQKIASRFGKSPADLPQCWTHVRGIAAILLKEKPDRLPIEPTGLAAVSGTNTLDRDGFKEKVDIRSIICLMDPARFEEDVMKPEVVDQIESSDVLLASRADLASADELKAFNEWGEALFPPKRHIGTMNKGSFHSHSRFDS